MTWFRSGGEPGKAIPIRGGGRTENRIRRREPDCRGFIESFTESLGGLGSMWRAQRSQGDIEFGVGDTDVAFGGEQLMEQGLPLLIAACS